MGATRGPLCIDEAIGGVFDGHASLSLNGPLPTIPGAKFSIFGKPKGSATTYCHLVPSTTVCPHAHMANVGGGARCLWEERGAAVCRTEVIPQSVVLS